MNDRNVLTMKDIARELGISVATVSRALQDSPRISEERRRMIQQYAREHNFYPNAFGEALRKSVFQVASIMTTTGYATANFDVWPQLSRVLLVTLMFIGASAGSTGGGLKVVRVQLLLKSMVRDIRRTVHPKSVNTVNEVYCIGNSDNP